MTFHVNTRSARWSHWRGISSPRWLLGRTTPRPSTVYKFHWISNIVICSHFQFLVQQKCVIHTIFCLKKSFSLRIWLNSADLDQVIYDCLLCKIHSFFSVYGHLFTFGSNKYGQLGVGDFRRRKGICRVGGGLTGKVVDTVTCGDGFTVASINGRFLLGDHFHLKVFWSTHGHQHCTLYFEHICSYFKHKFIICHLV